MSTAHNGVMTRTATTFQSDHPDVAHVAALFADASRTRIMFALFDGRALPASVLATEAGVSASTVSEHLKKLVDGGLIAVEQHGRFRYFRLANSAVADALESLTHLAPAQEVNGLSAYNRLKRLRSARTCYDHLAGRLGTSLMAWLHSNGALTRTDGHDNTQRTPGEPLSKPVRSAPYRLGPEAQRIFSAWNVDVDALQAARRPFIKVCVDWTEQSHHLAGGLGAGVLKSFLTLGWVQPGSRPREVNLTDAGQKALAQVV